MQPYILGIVVLKDLFQQRRFGPRYGSFRSRIPLHTPSGPQEVESDLEACFAVSASFAPGVYDILSQPIIEYRLNGERREYAADFAVQLYADRSGLPLRYIVEVKRDAWLQKHGPAQAERYAAISEAAGDLGFAFRIMRDVDIKTAYLLNARQLSRHIPVVLDNFDADAIDIIDNSGGQSVGQAIELLMRAGHSLAESRLRVERLLAHRLISWDPDQQYGESLSISGSSGVQNERTDAFLLRLEASIRFAKE
ncbi:MAG: hypothetical protein WCO82_04785 [Sphingomonadales bacterium]|jgi:hypothetical protein